MDGTSRWWRGVGAVVGSLAILVGGLAVAGTASAAATPTAKSGGRIDGGVEDGMFAKSCLKTPADAPATGVLRAKKYRQPVGQVVRILVPYDIATDSAITRRRHCFEQYLKDAKSLGAVVEVSLNSYGPAPSLATYTAAVTKLASFKVAKDITYLTAWNEPNNAAYLKVPASSRPLLAAEYFQAARSAFAKHHVTMVAGDFASGISRSFFNTYAGNLGSPWPTLWAIHPYTDVTNFEYYMRTGRTAEQAGRKAAAKSKVRQLALDLRGHGRSTRIWINEIYVDHRADKCPPAGVKVGGVTLASCKKHKGGLPRFSTRVQDAAARFLDGGLGAASLSGYLRGHGLPHLARYIYLRAWSYSTDKQAPDADVLEVHFHTALYCTLSDAC